MGVGAALLLSACAHRQAPLPPQDLDGCPAVPLKLHTKAMDRREAEALEGVTQAKTPAEAHVLITSFLILRRTNGPQPETYCQLKSAVKEANRLAEHQTEVLRYWNRTEVVAKSCSDADYEVARRHLHNLMLFAEARNDMARLEALNKQLDLLETIHGHVVRYHLCWDQPADIELYEWRQR